MAKLFDIYYGLGGGFGGAVFGGTFEFQNLEDAYREQVESWIVYEAKEHID